MRSLFERKIISPINLVLFGSTYSIGLERHSHRAQHIADKYRHEFSKKCFNGRSAAMDRF